MAVCTRKRTQLGRCEAPTVFIVKVFKQVFLPVLSCAVQGCMQAMLLCSLTASQGSWGQNVLNVLQVGVHLSKELMAIAGRSLKANITTLAPLVLPLSEQALFLANLAGRKVLRALTELLSCNACTMRAHCWSKRHS